MDNTFTVGFTLMGIYIVGQFAFIFYVQSAYKKLRNAIIARGRLISLIPVLTLTTVVHGNSVQPQGMPLGQQGMMMHGSAPPGYTATTETKSYPPPYAP